LIAGLRPIALFAVCAASLVLFGWQLTSDSTLAFFISNALPIEERKQLITMMASAVIVVVLIGLMYVALTGLRGALALSLKARLVAPLTLIALLPPLLDQSLWKEPHQAAVAIAVFVFLFERLWRVTLAAWCEGTHVRWPLVARVTPRARRTSTGIVLFGVLGYAVYVSTYTLFAHWRFQTYNFDLGQYDNIFWNALHGRPLVCTPLGAMTNWSSLSGHADFATFFLLPIYAIYPHAETLLVMQSVLLGLGAIPIYFFAARRLPPAYACVLAICYLLYPPLHGTNFYDFHFQPVAATFVLYLLWFLDIRRWFWAGLFYVLAITCREDISVGLTFLGLYLILTGYRPKAGTIMAVVGVIYFVVVRFYVMASYGPGWFSDIYKDLYPPGGPNSYGGVMQTLATNPIFVFRTLLTADKLKYFLQIVTPLAFLPLRRAYLLPALAPGALFTLLTTQYSPTTDIAFQYSGHFTAYIFMASAVALAACLAEGRIKGRAAAAALLVGTFLCTKHWGAFPPSGTFKSGFSLISFARPTAADFKKARDLAELAKLVPEAAPVAVSEQELPHVSDRFLKLLTLRDGAPEAEYILYGTSSAGAHIAAQVLASGQYVEIAQRPGLSLLRRK
jgi:uncharacterized membrane protein